MPNALAITPHASVAETGNGTGLSIDLGDRTYVELTLNVTAASGTSLAVVVEHSPTVAAWSQVALFTVVTTNTTQNLVIPVCSRYLRVVWTIVGAAPGFTFSVTGIAHQHYCSVDDFTRFGIPPQALDGVPIAERALACLQASSEAEGYFASAYTMPLVSIDLATRGHVARMSALRLMTFMGFAPDSGKDSSLEAGYTNAVSWLNRIAKGGLRPPGIVDSAPEILEPEVYVVSAAPRGWR